MSLAVLMIDDVADMRQFVKKSVERTFDCRVDEASDGIVAKAMMENAQYDLVLCDWGIPGLTGEELLMWARNNGTQKNIPFIMITGYRDREHVLRAVELGVSGYIVKPISLDTLMQKIKAVSKNFREK